MMRAYEESDDEGRAVYVVVIGPDGERRRIDAPDDLTTNERLAWARRLAASLRASAPSALKHCILETSRGGYVVSSFRDDADGRHFIVDDFQALDLESARNVARCRAAEFGGSWHDAPGY